MGFRSVQGYSRHKTLCRACVVNFNQSLTLTQTNPTPHQTLSPTLRWGARGRQGQSRGAFSPKKKRRAAERSASTIINSQTPTLHKVLCRPVLPIGQVSNSRGHPARGQHHGPERCTSTKQLQQKSFEVLLQRLGLGQPVAQMLSNAQI